LRFCVEEMDAEDVIVTADCDGQHTTEDVLKVYRATLRRGGGLVLGSRDFSGTNVPPRSRMGNSLIRGIYRMFYGLDLYDTQTGLRGFSVELAKRLATVGGDRFEYEMNVLIYAKRNDIPVSEIPIQTVYPDDPKDHVSHYKAVRDSLRILGVVLKNFNLYMGMTPNEYRQEKKQSVNNTDIYKISKGERIMVVLSEISENLQKGKAKIVKEMVQQAIDEGANVEQVLNEGLLSGMNVVGEKFKNNEVYVPEVLVAARAMNMGVQVLKPYLMASGVKATGKVCIGTVQGDLHDIGKNIVKMMMEGKGLEVVDLGTDVAPETFVQRAIDENCQVICCSALLTTTMNVMADVVKRAEEIGIRDKVKIMIGGAPINQEYCDSIGADCYTVDAASAADAAVEFCK